MARPHSPGDDDRARSETDRIAEIEARLRAGEDRLRLALDAARMGSWEWDIATGRLDWSGHLEAIHGMRPGTFDGTFERFASVIHPDDRPDVDAAIARALDEDDAFSVEFRVIAETDGDVRWVSGEGRVVRDDDGRPRRMIGIGRDLTARRRAEEALRESEERFRSMADSAPVLIWITDVDGACTYLNQGWLQFTGRPAEEQLGDGWAESVHPDDAERCLAAYRDAFARREPFEMEYRLRHASGAHRWVLDRGLPRFGAGAQFEGFIGSCVDIDDRRWQEETDRLLAEVATTLAGPLSLEERLDALARALVPRMFDACVVDLVDDAGRLRRAAASHVDPALSDALAALPTPRAASPIGVVAAGGPARLIEDVGDDDLVIAGSDDLEEMALRRRLEPRSAAVAPLVSRGERIGVLALSTSRAHSDRRLERRDLAVAVDLADRAAVAIDNARLFDRERTARARVQFLAEAGLLLSSSLDYHETLGSVAALAVPQLADWCTVHMLSDGGALERVAIAHSDPAWVRRANELADRYPSDPAADYGVGAVVRSGTPQLVEDIPDELIAAAARDPEHLEAIRAFDLASYVCVPLRFGGEVLGALTLVADRRSGRRFGQDDLRLAEGLADRAAAAIGNARLYRAQHTIATTLQQALLPQRLPEIAHLRVGASYVAAGTGVEVGGDFYDVVPCPDGGWLMVIGDVCGKGPRAASLTALARYTLRALADAERDPVGLLRRLNRQILLQRPGNTRFITICAGLVSPPDASGDVRVRLATGGHPPPVVLRADGAAAPAGVRGPLVGVLEDVEPGSGEVVLAAGDRLVFFTDGLTEAPDGDGRLGEEGVTAAVARLAGAPTAGLARDLAEEVRGAGAALRDDVAVLVVEAVGAGPAGDPATSRAQALPAV